MDGLAGTVPDRLSCRRAVEALRNGVPNPEAVRILGSTQPHAEQQFQTLLHQAANGASPEAEAQNPRGLLISGDFGTGKSHLLEHFEHLALDRNFVCSRIAVSKETPFYDLAKMFRSAVDNGSVPGGKVGLMVDEIGLGLNTNSPGYAHFYRWANETANGLHRIFPATLMVHERLHDQELLSAIRWFWSGDKIAVGAVKGGLRQVGQQGAYTFRAPKLRELPPQRLRFVLEMIKAGGYRGWVVLIDELELVGSYSVLQRARSYAELARWMGDTADDCPGLVVAAAITDDFAEAILEQKEDRLKVASRMRERGDEDTAQRAETGMEWIASRRTRLHDVTADAVEAAVDTIRRIYSSAYGWQAPPATTPSGAGYQKRMRYKVRSAITAWDLQRLHPDSRPEMESREYHSSYTEDPDLEVEAKDDEPNS
jgi:hypothetical protein